MLPPAPDLPLTPRERLRWRRAMDARLIEAIFGRVVRDEVPAALLDMAEARRPSRPSAAR